MPVLKVYLDTSRHSTESLTAFLKAATTTFANTLESPQERIRVYLLAVAAEHMAIGGVIRPPADLEAPFFEFYLLAGRPAEHKRRLIEDFTALLANLLGYRASQIRGCCWHVAPDDWGIGGVSAAEIRAREIAIRAEKLV